MQEVLTVTPGKLPNFEENTKKFFMEHLHDHEEIRFILDGIGGLGDLNDFFRFQYKSSWIWILLIFNLISSTMDPFNEVSMVTLLTPKRLEVQMLIWFLLWCINQLYTNIFENIFVFEFYHCILVQEMNYMSKYTMDATQRIVRSYLKWFFKNYFRGYLKIWGLEGDVMLKSMGLACRLRGCKRLWWTMDSYWDKERRLDCITTRNVPQVHSRWGPILEGIIYPL